MLVSDKRQVQKLSLLFAAVYMVGYLTRVNYSTIISSMVEQTDFSKDSLSMALTGSFITYGIAQVFSGIMGDRINPKQLVMWGLTVTVTMNILLPLCPNPIWMCVVWCINGVAQSFLWPPMVRMMNILFSEETYKVASKRISWGGSVGTILLYLLSPLVLLVLPWKAVFWICAALGVVMMLIWWISAPDIAVAKADRRIKNKADKRIFSPVMVAIMAAIAIQGMLRDGVTTWMPSYISETYQLNNGVSILSGVALPIVSIVSLQIASHIYGGKRNNPVSCAALIFAVGSVAAFCLFCLNGRNAVVSVALSALLTGCMHGVNMMLICMIPPFFRKNGNVSAVSGILNACTYIGSAISAYGIARLSQMTSWKAISFVWFASATAGAVICILVYKTFAKQFIKSE